jgi:hypothetical protein
MQDIDEINDMLGLSLGETVHGKELKGWKRVEGDTIKFYLDADECQKLSEAFRKLSEKLRNNG